MKASPRWMSAGMEAADAAHWAAGSRAAILSELLQFRDSFSLRREFVAHGSEGNGQFFANCCCDVFLHCGARRCWLIIVAETMSEERPC